MPNHTSVQPRTLCSCAFLAGSPSRDRSGGETLNDAAPERSPMRRHAYRRREPSLMRVARSVRREVLIPGCPNLRDFVAKDLRMRSFGFRAYQRRARCQVRAQRRIRRFIGSPLLHNCVCCARRRGHLSPKSPGDSDSETHRANIQKSERFPLPAVANLAFFSVRIGGESRMKASTNGSLLD
jgi:hypothetical protein